MHLPCRARKDVGVRNPQGMRAIVVVHQPRNTCVSLQALLVARPLPPTLCDQLYYRGAMSDRRGEVVEVLQELAQLTILDEGNVQSFRVRAYENAKRAVENLSGDITALSEAELCKVDGIGKSTAKKIREYLASGAMTKLETLRTKFPPGVVALSRIPGIGPKAVTKLRKQLGIESIADLKVALDNQEVRKLAGFGEKSEQKLLRALERLGLNAEQPRTPLADALPLARRIVSELSLMPEVVKASYCGSMRRFSETIGDVDIIAAATNRAAVMSTLR